MAFDPEFIKHKFECQVAQVRARKLKYDYNSWHLIKKNDYYQLDGSGFVYPLALFIEGRYGGKTGFGSNCTKRTELHAVASALGMSYEEMGLFNSGFTTRGIMPGLPENKDKIQKLGIEVRNKIDPVKPNSYAYTFATNSTTLYGTTVNFNGQAWMIVNR